MQSCCIIKMGQMYLANRVILLFKVAYYSLFVFILFIILMINFYECNFLLLFKISINQPQP